MTAGPRKWSLTLAGHRTSVSLEAPFREALGEMAAARGLSLNALAAEIDAARPAGTGLASALRLAVLAHLRAGAALAGACRKGDPLAPS
ncbi:MAG: ribbon-helix-helix domain-containing protein [Rhodobacteraceae bacterium]|nr:ribbon-helix-helix domain-containing protein [Paracoccaceae bacterium]